MKTLKIVAIAVLAATTLTLGIATASAMMGKPGYYTPYQTSTGTYATPPGTNMAYGGNYGGYYVGNGGMMGGWGCQGMMRSYGYGAPTYNSPTPLA